MRKWIIGISALSVVSVLQATPATDSLGASNVPSAPAPSAASLSNEAAVAAAAVSAQNNASAAAPVPMENLSTANANVPAPPAPNTTLPKRKLAPRQYHHYKFHCMHWVPLNAQTANEIVPGGAAITHKYHCTQWVAWQSVNAPATFGRATVARRNHATLAKTASRDVASASTESAVSAPIPAQNRFVVNGFMSAGVATTDTKANYNIPTRGSVNHDLNYMMNSLVGLQVTANMTQQLSAITQVIATGDNTNGNTAYQPQLDWAFLRYSVNNNLQVRGGHLRVPALFYSETQDVGYSYPWVTVPNEVYSVVPFNDMNGVNVIYSHPIDDSSWSVELQPFAGQSETRFDVISDDALLFNENNFVGASASVSNPYINFRGSYAHTQLNIANNASVGAVDHKNMDFYDFGVQSNIHNVLVTSEFAHRDTPNNLASLTGFYAMLGYQYNKWLPNFTYGHLSTTNKNAMPVALQSTLPEAQQSYTLGLNYYINSFIVSKVSASLIQPQNGTNGLFTDTNSSLAKNIMLYGVSFDAIF